MKFAFFDFDGTLIKHDSFIQFARYCVGNTVLLKAIIKSSPWLLLWKAGIKSNSEAKEKLFSELFKGMRYEYFTEKCHEFVHYIIADERAEIVAKLNCHKKKGHNVIIVSASIRDWIEPWAEFNGVHEVLATEIEVDGHGRITGKFSTPNCHGQEKVRRIMDTIPDISGHESWAYGDSNGDKPMLELSNHPNKV